MTLQNEEESGTVGTTDQQSADTQNTTENVEPETTGTSTGSSEEGVPSQQIDPNEYVDIERYRNAQARMTQATQESADLRREVAALQAQISATQDQGQQNPPPQDSGISGNNAELTKLRTEYPEFAGPIVDVLERQQKVISDLRAQNDAVAASTDAVRKTTFVQAVEAAHPDMEAVVTSDDFKGWLYRQPQFVQDAIVSGDPTGAIKILGMYKADTSGASSQPNKQALLDAAKQVAAPVVGRNTQQPATEPKIQFTREQISAMSPDEFAKNEVAIDEAMAAGLIA